MTERKLKIALERAYAIDNYPAIEHLEQQIKNRRIKNDNRRFRLRAESNGNDTHSSKKRV